MLTIEVESEVLVLTLAHLSQGIGLWLEDLACKVVEGGNRSSYKQWWIKDIGEIWKQAIASWRQLGITAALYRMKVTHSVSVYPT